MTGPLDNLRAQATEAEVVEVLKTIRDPELPISIWDMGLIYFFGCQCLWVIQDTEPLASHIHRNDKVIYYNRIGRCLEQTGPYRIHGPISTDYGTHVAFLLLKPPFVSVIHPL